MPMLGAIGLGVLALAAWLGLRAPAPPQMTSVAPPTSLPAVSAPQPAGGAPVATAPIISAPVISAPVAPAPAPAPVVPSTGATVASRPSAMPPPVVTAPPLAAAPNPSPSIAQTPSVPQAAAPAPVLPVAPIVPQPATTPPSLAAPAPAPAAPPSFDIVRVNPQGGTVLAGRAAPEAEVVLRANGREIGRTRADAQGQWVMAGAAPLVPGAQEITVATVDGAGREIAGVGAVVAVVPERPAQVAAASPAPAGTTQAAPPSPPATTPLVLMTTPQGAPTLLQAPGRAAGAARLGLDLVDYDDAGEIRFAGTAPPGTTLRVYVDDGLVGETVVGADGRWALMPQVRVAAGDHRLRLDQVDRTGRVIARIEQPFQRAAVTVLDPGVQRVVVQPQQNLWRIARRAYGRGVRYTEIFAANRDQIRDPALIYPGQVFTIPAAAPAGQR